MSLSCLPVETAGNDIAGAQMRAIDAFLRVVALTTVAPHPSLVTGAQDALTCDDDHCRSLRANTDLTRRDAGYQQYLDWGIGLVAQVERKGEGDLGIRLVRPTEAAAS
ncbi:hypothetical protein AB4Z48_35470 [Cupriavidus sp. 2TAF22]|uniref:hypothetical protein n=1 Tax=unclassified Cupriavidus TaxID=2640874 RepID=UPI003F929484